MIVDELNLLTGVLRTLDLDVVFFFLKSSLDVLS